MKAIETIYKGYRFRSRLEARWAVFFDAIRAEWEYEPEGFVLNDGSKYLPDFLLHNVSGRGASEMYVEIKGVLTDKDYNKISLFSYGNGNNVLYNEADNPIIIFGKIPEEYYLQFGTIGGKNAGQWFLDYSKDNDDRFYNLELSEGDFYWTQPKARKGGGLVLDYPDNPYDYVDKELTIKAYRAARQARFEYGAVPIQMP